MRHRNKKMQLNRFTSWRKATIKSLLRSLVLYQSIRTTKHKAKAARPYADKLIWLAKKGDLAARRRAFVVLGDHRLVQRLFTQLAPLFAKRSSGYTRILPLSNRRGDGAELVLFEFTEKKAEAAPVVKKAVAERTGEKEKPREEIKKPKAAAEPQPQEQKRPEKDVKPKKKFLGGIRNIFKKERDSL
ncbi:MAG: 50S ribosomal protein L17 [Candidatus Omnitrophica bacterium]|nr:50S ribosomal protein L17 [Candidatus Omnitrophota bacterium]